MSAAPRFSTADIARGAQQRKNEPADATPNPTPNPDATLDTKPVVSREPDTAAIERRDLGNRDSGMREMANREAANREAANLDAANRDTANRDVAIERRDPAIENRNRLIEEDSNAPLFASEASQGFQHRWDGIQASFIDDPRKAVEEADALVAETMQRLAETFAQERERLEHQFRRETTNAQAAAEDARAAERRATSTSTEDLRIALRHYRSFFKRLLSV